MTDEHRWHIEQNYRAFLEQLPVLLATQAGRFALLREGQIAQFYDSPGEAAVAGQQTWPDGLYSVQEVISIPINLGYHSHAMS